MLRVTPGTSPVKMSRIFTPQGKGSELFRANGDMLISDFDYELPDELIAQNPLEKRENSRMLVVGRAEKSFQDEHFYNFLKFLKKDDVIVLNNTKVFPARLFGKSETGAKIELFLVREIENQIWETLGRPARRLNAGKKIMFSVCLSFFESR